MLAAGGPGVLASSMIEELCAILRGELAALPAGDEGERLLDLARRHRVHLLAAWRLRAARPPAAVPETLLADVRVEAVHDVLRTRELVRVTRALETAGCAPLVFKGAALAHSHYPESWTRPRVDTDVLIAPDHEPQAAAAMESLGYERPPLIAGRLVMHQAMFVAPDEQGGEHVVDVHWRVANPNLVAGAVSHADLIRRAASIATPDGALAVPSPVDALLIACVHRAAHHDDSEDLLWLFDIHLLAARLSEDEWTRVAALAARGRVRSLCRRGLALAAARFGAIDARILATLDGGDEEPSAVFLRKDLRLVDRLRADVAALGLLGGARLVREHLFPPFAYMRGAYGVTSRALLPVYYLRRILAGVGKWFRPPA